MFPPSLLEIHNLHKLKNLGSWYGPSQETKGTNGKLSLCTQHATRPSGYKHAYCKKNSLQKVQQHGAHTIFKGDTFRCFQSELLDFLLLKFKLSPFPQFVFEYETGWETGAVIALDDLSISHGSCFSPPVDPPGNDDDDDYGNLKLHSAVSILLFLFQEIRTGQFGKFCLVNWFL